MEGLLINDKYIVGEKIGSGSFSSVYVVHDKNNPNNKFCCKIIPRNKIVDAKDMNQLEREVQCLSKIRHKSIAQFINFFIGEENYYIIMELINGYSLVKFLNASGENGLSIRLIWLITSQLIQVLYFLHSNGIVHRDIKLENIIVCKDMTIKLIDFGFCNFSSSCSSILGCKSESETIFSKNGTTLFQTICGTLSFLAPECILGAPYDGFKSDMWSAGVVIYAIALRKLPFVGENQIKLCEMITSGNYQLPDSLIPELADLIVNLLRVDPNDRMTAAEAMNHPFVNLNSKPFNHSMSSTKFPPLKPINLNILQKTTPTEGQRRRSFPSSRFAAINLAQQTQSPSNSPYADANSLTQPVISTDEQTPNQNQVNDVVQSTPKLSHFGYRSKLPIQIPQHFTPSILASKPKKLVCNSTFT